MDNSNLAQEIAQLHAELCSALADPTRLLILYALAEQAVTVNELTQKLAIPQPNISRHLKVLRDGGLVHATRQGMSVQYELADQRVIQAMDLLRAVLHDRIQHNVNLIDELIPS
jgi:DNA-binding transcriptional ArsR family regulator